MQFKHPEFLYALFLLLIPIIVHLFQLRRFQKVDFTNVKFLKRVIIQTRKSSLIKKWLTLITRLLLLACLIFAFAQPYFSKTKTLNQPLEYVIYLDNSFSMHTNGPNGELLKRAVQNLIFEIPEQQNFTLFTNNHVFNNVSVNDIKNDLIDLEYSSTRLDYNASLLKGKQLFSKDNSSLKQFLFISDFQKNQGKLDFITDSTYQLNLVKLNPINTANISIDSLYLDTNNQIHVQLNSNNESLKNLSVSLFENNNLIAKTAILTDNETTAIFTLPNTTINGKITIEDNSLDYDNSLYFNINKPSKINVLSINEADDNYLKRIYSDNRFAYSSSALNQLNYSAITDQNLVVLNELQSINPSLNVALKSFINDGGNIVIIPSNKTILNTYNQLLNNYNINLSNKQETAKTITTINFDHPVFESVFDSKVKNFQFPKVETYYNLSSSSEPILKFENESAFLTSNNNVFVFSSALNKENSNFINSPLIVPTLFNIGKQSLKQPQFFYHIGKENSVDVNIKLTNDAILKLENSESRFIPLQQTYSNKVNITTLDNPSNAGIYSIVYDNEIVEYISYNYNRLESNLEYYSNEELSNFKVNNSVPQFFETIKNDSNINELWKWFVIFALVFLVLEMVILKYFK